MLVLTLSGPAVQYVNVTFEELDFHSTASLKVTYFCSSIIAMPQTPIPSGHPSPTKQISGLPQYSSPYYHDIHMDTAKGLTSLQSYNDIRMATAKGNHLGDDIRMETARGGSTVKPQSGFQVWERELLDSGEVKRKATVAQLCKYSWDRFLIPL